MRPPALLPCWARISRDLVRSASSYFRDVVLYAGHLFFFFFFSGKRVHIRVTKAAGQLFPPPVALALHTAWTSVTFWRTLLGTKGRPFSFSKSVGPPTANLSYSAPCEEKGERAGEKRLALHVRAARAESLSARRGFLGYRCRTMRAFHGHRSRDKRQRTRAFRGAASQNKAAPSLWRCSSQRPFSACSVMMSALYEAP